MTWHTPSGDRFLEGDEAVVVREVLAIIVDRLAEKIQYDDEDAWAFGVKLVDQLKTTQQISLMKHIADALLTQTEGTPELTSISEAAIYTIYQTLLYEIESEIEDVRLVDANVSSDDEWLSDWRVLAWKAYQETGEDIEEFYFDDASPIDNAQSDRVRDDKIQDENCLDMEEWRWVVESLADNVLWDRDFEMDEDFIDAEPERSQLIKTELGIDQDYFSAIAPDAEEHDVQTTLASLRRLTHDKPR